MPTLRDTIWTRLAVPFPDDEVKQRPGAAKWDHKEACQGNRCRETRDPDKHVQFSYVDARAVAQRLDDVVTPAGWEFTCGVIPGTDVVKGRLSVIEDGRFVTREDHGYPNSERDEEPVKAATSDALKRCAVLFGIGRHLYEDNKPHRPATRPLSGQTAPVAAPVAAAPVRSSTAVPDDFADLDWEHLSPAPPTAVPTISGTVAVTDRVPLSDGENWCPVHGLAWVLQPAGTSKNGAPYDAFWKCSSKDKPYCKEHPTKQWVEMRTGQPVAAG